jgi:hypothetical protein
MAAYPSLSVGPGDRGRSYGVLAHCLAPQDFKRFRPVIEDFSLALAAWADLGLTRFSALVPLDAERSAFVLWRARHLGTAELGTVAVANGLYLTAEAMTALEGRAHRLLALLPEPDGRPFGQAAVTAPDTAPGGGPVLPAFGLEWRDQVIDVLDAVDPEALLVAALEGVTPQAQAMRIDGWATTGALQSSSAFDPDDAFRLVVRSADEPVGSRLADRRRVQFKGGRIVTAPDTAPAVWRVWQAVERAAAGFAVPVAGWKPSYLAMPSERLATVALLQASAGLGANDRLDLIAGAVREVAAQPDIRPEVEAAAGHALMRLAATADSGLDAVHYLEAGLTEEGRFGAGCARVIALNAPLDANIAALDKIAVERAMAHGMLDRVAARPIEETVGLFEPEALALILKLCMALAGESAPVRALAVGLIAHLAKGTAADREAASVGLTILLGLERHVLDTGLATLAVAKLARQLPPNERADFNSHAVKPILRGHVAVSRRAFDDAMRALKFLLDPAA